MTLMDSLDPCVKGVAPVLQYISFPSTTGRRFKPSAAVSITKATLGHRNIVVHVQQVCQGSPPSPASLLDEVRWSRAGENHMALPRMPDFKKNRLLSKERLPLSGKERNGVPGKHFQTQAPLNTARDWEMQVDLSQRLTFPPEIAATDFCPDLVLWSKSCRHILVVAVTDPLDQAFQRK